MAFDASAFLNLLPHDPGVYRMYDAQKKLIYVGKARHLNKRLQQYFGPNLGAKTSVLVSKIADIEYTITESEVDALLLEANLIKHHRPRYNILLRDDKSYPYLYISTHTYPRLDYVRGKKKLKGTYYGPYPNTGVAKQALNLLQKCFQLRQCQDSVFRHRSRPCLQYQIQRCKAPCVGLIAQADYQKMVEKAQAFFQGNSHQVLLELTQQMKQAASDFHYEKASLLRDQIQCLRQLQQHQYIATDKGDLDVIALSEEDSRVAICVLYIRHGKILGHRCYFPSLPSTVHLPEVVFQFLSQYYLNCESPAFIPERLVLSEKMADKHLLESALTLKAKKRVQLIQAGSEPYLVWRRMAWRNAKQALLEQSTQELEPRKKLLSLQKALNLDQPIKRIECFDVSHTQGEATCASCVVYGQSGTEKAAYRLFNIKEAKSRDDYAALKEAIGRRYYRLRQQAKSMPDVLIVDGGAGQLKQALEVLGTLNIQGVFTLGVAKGVSRKAGLEKLILPHNGLLQLPRDSQAFHLIQFIRDEAHRFSIQAQKKARDKKRRQSVLENIHGIGPRRRQALLIHFGGLRGLKQASIADIAKVPGIDLKLAEKIWGKVSRH